MARCQGTTKSGARCKRGATGAEDYCSVHGRDRTTSTGPDAPAPEKDAVGQETPDQDGAGTDRAAKKGFRSKHINSGEDLLHLAIGAVATLAMLWLLKRGPRPPGL